MILATSLKGFPSKKFKNIVLTLGAFDGVHLGHKKVLGRVLKAASAINGTAVLLTFQEHPQKVLHPGVRTPILTSFWHKMDLLSKSGVQLCVALHFNVRFSKLSPEDFVKKILLKKLQVRRVILGHDSRFGRNRQGDARVMSAFARKYGFSFAVVPPYKKAGKTVSSTMIRGLIQQGDLAGARRYLGRPYSVMATVIPGSGRGKVLGFPTANLDPHSEVLPPPGVYMVRVRLLKWGASRDCSRSFSRIGREEQRFFPAVLNLGTRPTFGTDERGLVPEVHILRFDQDLYGKEVEVEFVRKMRNEMRFSSVSALKDQIEKDVYWVRKRSKLAARQA